MSNLEANSPAESIADKSNPASSCSPRALQLHRLALSKGFDSSLRLWQDTYPHGDVADRVQLGCQSGFLTITASWERMEILGRWELHSTSVAERNPSSLSATDWRKVADRHRTCSAGIVLASLKDIERGIRSSAPRMYGKPSSMGPEVRQAAIVYNALQAATRAAHGDDVPADLRDEVRDAANECDISIVGLNAAVPGARRAAIMAQRARRAAEGGA